MTWKLKVRTSPGAPITCAFECPEHGHFTATVPRDDHGDPPDAMPCAACGLSSPWRPTAPAGRVSLASVAMGKVGDYPPGYACLDTRPLADGVSTSEWRAKQGAITRDALIKKRRQMTGQRGKIFVG